MGGGACIGLVLRTRVPEGRYANKGSMVSNQETGFCAGVTTRDLAMSAMGKPMGVTGLCVALSPPHTAKMENKNRQYKAYGNHRKLFLTEQKQRPSKWLRPKGVEEVS